MHSQLETAARDYAGLPYKAINKILSLDLASGLVHLSEKAHQHIAERHTGDYPAVMPILAAVIAAPDFAGWTPLHPGNFFLIKESRDDVVLVAISKYTNEFGKLPLQSSYLIDHSTLQRRLRKGYIKAVEA